MKKIYTDTRAGNKVKALQVVAQKGANYIVTPATAKEPTIQEHALMSLTAIKRAAITRAHRPSVDASPHTGDMLIGIQKAFYRDQKGQLFLVLAVSCIEYGARKKPVVRLSKVAIPANKASIVTQHPSLEIPVYTYITGEKEVPWMSETIEKALGSA